MEIIEGVWVEVETDEFSRKAVDILLSSPLVSEVLWYGNRKAHR